MGFFQEALSISGLFSFDGTTPIQTTRGLDSRFTREPDRFAKQKIAYQLVLRSVSLILEIDKEELLIPDRGNASTARARQIIAYLMHTGLSLTLSETADVMERDRSTVGHACRVIEDLRDCKEIDSQLAELEETTVLIRKLIEDE